MKKITYLKEEFIMNELTELIHSMSDEEINNRRIELFNYFLSLGVGVDEMVEMITLISESAIRMCNKKIESV